MDSCVPSGWRLGALGDIADSRVDLWQPASSDTMPYVALEHIAQGSPKLLGYARSSEATSTKAMFRKGDLLFGKLRPNLRKAVLAPFDGICSTDILVIRARRDSDPGYLECLAHYPPVQEHAVSTASGTKMPRTSWPLLKSCVVPIPPLVEQRKIAGILSSVDETIERTEAVIAQLDVVKKAMLEELLTRGIPGRHSRFKQTEIGEVPEEWVPEPLGNCIDLISGQHLLADDCDDDPRGTPYLTGPTDFPDGEVVVSKFTKAPKVMCEPGDVLVTVKGSGTGKLAKATGAYCISRQLMAARPRDCDGGFLYYLLSQATEELRAAASGLIPGIGRDQILGLQVKWPPRPEQQEIAGILGAVDHRIACEAREVGALRAAKAALSDSLLSGRVRVEPGEA